MPKSVKLGWNESSMGYRHGWFIITSLWRQWNDGECKTHHPQIGIQYYVIWGSVNNDGTIYILLDILLVVAFWGEGSDFGDSAFFWAIWSTNVPSINILHARSSQPCNWLRLAYVERQKIAGFLLGIVYFFGGGRWIGYWLFYITLCSIIVHDWLMIGPCWATPAAFSQVLACALLVFYRRDKVGSVTTLGHGLPPTRNVLVDLRRFCRFKNAADMRLHEITESAADMCIYTYLHI